MSIQSVLGDNARRQIAEGMSRVLADSYTLYLKTHNFHWNVEGPQFRALHMMFEEQYKELALAVDDIAERIRALGEYAPGSYSQFVDMAVVKEARDVPTATEMVRMLAADHGTVATTIRSLLAAVQQAGDEVSVGLLVDRLAVHEKTMWMLHSSLKDAR